MLDSRQLDGPKVLITGAAGFVGGRLLAALADRHPDWRLAAPPGPPAEYCLDIRDAIKVKAWVAGEEPDIVIHLAAVAAVTASVKDPRLAWEVNLGGTLNLVLALQELAPQAHLLFVSSAEVYGASFAAQYPLDETALLQPVNPYAASKAAADILVRQAASAGLSATVMRAFNHTGPGQSTAFVAPNFANQIARIEAGLQPPVIEVGNLDDERDFLDVDDVVAAYVLVLERGAGSPGADVFNVASGAPLRIGDMLERLLSLAKVKIDVRIDESRLRRTPIARVAGNASRLRSLGWIPVCSIENTLANVLEERRQVLRQSIAIQGA